jgi:CRISPR-associated protein Cas1
MGALYIDRRGAELRWSDGALEIRCDDEPPRSLPGRLLELVVLRADTRLTSATLAALADAGVGLVAFGGRGGQRVAQMLGAPHHHARLRIAQCLRSVDADFAAAWAARLVRAKLGAQARLLARARTERADLRKPLGDALATLHAVARALRSGTPPPVASVRGIEGAGAAAYFAGYTALFAPALGFTGRRRRPPPDPVNACLSLGYTLLHAEAVRACWAAGLDPMVGLLHAPASGRASMACDLVEPWRAQVDAWVWQQFRSRALREEHFGRDGAGACLLGKAGRAHYYEAFAPLQRRLAAALQRHARAAALALSNGVALPAADDDDGDDAPAD